MIFEVSKSLSLAHMSHKLFEDQVQFLGNDGQPVTSSKLISDMISPSQNFTTINFKKVEASDNNLALPNHKSI